MPGLRVAHHLRLSGEAAWRQHQALNLFVLGVALEMMKNDSPFRRFSLSPVPSRLQLVGPSNFASQRLMAGVPLSVLQRNSTGRRLTPPNHYGFGFMFPPRFVPD